MSFSRGLKWGVLAVLLAVSLGWKLAARPSALPDGTRLQARIAEFLGRQRLSIVLAENIEDGKPLLQARGGPCRLMVIKSPAIGWDRDMIRRHASNDDDVLVLYRGNIYREQPAFRTAVDFLWVRLQRELGFNSQYYPIVAVVSTKACEVREMPWRELAF